MLTRAQNLGGTAPLKFGKAINVQNSARFRTTFDLTTIDSTLNAEKLVDLDSLTTKLCLLISTYPNGVYNYDRFYVEHRKIRELRFTNNKFCCLISNHSSLTLCLLYMYIIMQLHLGHMTLLQTKVQPLNCPPNQT